MGYFRWVVCALLFFATTINYIDRQVLGILAPDLQTHDRLDRDEYGNIVTAFQAAYAIGLLLVGPAARPHRHRARLRAGARASGAWPRWPTRLARTPFGFGVARFALGPRRGRATSRPPSRRWPSGSRRRSAPSPPASSTPGTNVGAIVAPLVVPWHRAHTTAGSGRSSSRARSASSGSILWLLALPTARRRIRGCRRRSWPTSAATPRSRPAQHPVAAASLPHRQTWAFALGKFMTDPIWWFYLYWLPKFLNEKYGLTLTKSGRRSS